MTMVIFLFSLLAFLSPLTLTSSSLSLLHQHPFPESVVQELHRRVNESFTRRQTLETNCHTGNPIDDCWGCDQNWIQTRQKLSECGIGFGQSATGGKAGEIYIVTDSSDNDPQNPTPGTIRYGLVQSEPLWITFSTDMHIKLKEELVFTSYKTVDGRGAKVLITGTGCLTLHNVNNIIVHGVEIRDCVASHHCDGDAIHVHSSNNVWIDHCTLSSCADGLIDVTEGSTAITISNNYFSNHDKVMLLGHNDEFLRDTGMQVTVAFNYFGPKLVQRMPRCRLGYVHVVNNDYTAWEHYAVGGSAKPTINSQGNRYSASINNVNNKEVTKRLDANEKEWASWNWRSEGDIMVNGAFFVASGAGGLGTEFAKASSLNPNPAYLIDSLTANAGVAFTRDVNHGGSSNPPPSTDTDIIYEGNGQNNHNHIPIGNVATTFVVSAIELVIWLSCSFVLILLY